MATQRQPQIVTPEEYLETQRTAAVRSEYILDETYEMSASSRQHGEIVVNVAGELRSLLRGKSCQAGVAITVRAPASYLIPDLVVYCNGDGFTDQDEVLNNPVVIFEILSPSTADFDHGHKWMLYQQVPSLMHYVMISQDKPHVEVYSREADDWRYKAYTGLDVVIRLTSADIDLSLAAVYERVSFGDQY